MTYSVSILSEAENDIDNAYIWYELRQIDLWTRFYKSVDDQFNLFPIIQIAAKKFIKELGDL